MISDVIRITTQLDIENDRCFPAHHGTTFAHPRGRWSLLRKSHQRENSGSMRSTCSCFFFSYSGSSSFSQLQDAFG